MPTSASHHTAFQRLPVVDIHGLFAADLPTRQATARLLDQAARDAGFLYITGHGVPEAQVQRLVARAQAYFAQALGDKMAAYIGHSSNHSGYVPQGEEQFYGAKPDLKEAYDVGFDCPPELPRRPMLGINQWPAMPGFREDVQAYYQAVFALSQALFRGFALALGLPEDRFTRHIHTPPSQLRLVHYPYAADMPADRPGIGAHTDYECFTILLPTCDGLEVQNGAGEWIDAPVLPGAFVINIGDMMEVLSNGHYVATTHRVRKVSQERYAFPLFCALDSDTVIAPLPELIAPGDAARYTPVVCGDHLYAQTLQTFAYLKARVADGRLQLPPGARELGSFGHGGARPQDAVDATHAGGTA
jgi:isopenicillin N synthase-like dioxygenase